MIDIEIELKTGILRKCHSETKRKANALSNKKKSKQWIIWRNYEEIPFGIDLKGLKSGSKDKCSCDPVPSLLLWLNGTMALSVTLFYVIHEFDRFLHQGKMLPCIETYLRKILSIIFSANAEGFVLLWAWITSKGLGEMTKSSLPFTDPTATEITKIPSSSNGLTAVTRVSLSFTEFWSVIITKALLAVARSIVSLKILEVSSSACARSGTPPDGVSESREAFNSSADGWKVRLKVTTFKIESPYRIML